MNSLRPVNMDMQIDLHDRMMGKTRKHIKSTKKKLQNAEILLNLMPLDLQTPEYTVWDQKIQKLIGVREELDFPTMGEIKVEYSKKRQEKLLAAVQRTIQREAKRKAELLDGTTQKRKDNVITALKTLRSKKRFGPANYQMGPKEEGEEMKKINNYKNKPGSTRVLTRKEGRGVVNGTNHFNPTVGPGKYDISSDYLYRKHDNTFQLSFKSSHREPKKATEFKADKEFRRSWSPTWEKRNSPTQSFQISTPCSREHSFEDLSYSPHPFSRESCECTLGVNPPTSGRISPQRILLGERSITPMTHPHAKPPQVVNDYDYVIYEKPRFENSVSTISYVDPDALSPETNKLKPSLFGSTWMNADTLAGKFARMDKSPKKEKDYTQRSLILQLSPTNSEESNAVVDEEEADIEIIKNTSLLDQLQINNSKSFEKNYSISTGKKLVVEKVVSLSEDELFAQELALADSLNGEDNNDNNNDDNNNVIDISADIVVSDNSNIVIDTTNATDPIQHIVPVSENIINPPVSPSSIRRRQKSNKGKLVTKLEKKLKPVSSFTKIDLPLNEDLKPFLKQWHVDNKIYSPSRPKTTEFLKDVEVLPNINVNGLCLHDDKSPLKELIAKKRELIGQEINLNEKYEDNIEIINDISQVFTDLPPSILKYLQDSAIPDNNNDLNESDKELGDYNSDEEEFIQYIAPKK
jgi:hypothetical protein